MRWASTLVVPLAIATLVGASAPQSIRSTAWSNTAELTRPRAYASATLLPTGEIFVFGGLDESDPDVVNLTTELVDPLTNAVRVVDQPVPGRLHHTSTFAAGDRLVVAGGVEWYTKAFHSSDRVDVYLPFQHRWTRAAPLLQARSDHGAAALRDGRVLVTGGNVGTVPLASSEIYDATTDTWTKAAPLPEPRLRFSIATLRDGRVLAAGGLSKAGVPLRSSVIYDPARDVWTPGPDMSVARVQQASVQLRNGDVLIIGGQFAAASTAERYDPVHNAFVYAGTLVEPRLIEQAAVLPDGRVLITGGSLQLGGDQRWVPVNKAEVWDPATNVWSTFASPAVNRALGDLVVTEKDAYLIGGIGDGLSALRAIERLPLR